MKKRARSRRRGCTLVAADFALPTRQGPVLVAGVTLHLSDGGIDVVSPSGRRLASVPWSEGSLAPRASNPPAVRALCPRGRSVVELRMGDRAHLFIAPTPDVTAFLATAADMGRPLSPAARRHVKRAWMLRARVPTPRRRAVHRVRREGPRAALALIASRIRLPTISRRAHAPALRINPIAACFCALALVGGGAALGSMTTGGASATTDPVPVQGLGHNVSIMDRMAHSYAGLRRPFVLPAATAPPAPAPPSLAAGPPISPHEIFGFLPYWTLPSSSGVNVAGYTTLSYFSVDVNSDGSIVQGGPGWVGYQSQALADLVTRAHGTGDRVVLTATCFGQTVLDKLATDPNAPTVLATSLVQLVAAKNLDGVNIDFEGKGSQDQAGLDHLIATVSAAVRQANPHWQLTMDTYASAAGDHGGFYDIAGLNPSVDAFFVMAYDMNDPTSPSPTAPLTGAGFTDLDAVQQYASVVPPSKVILGVPYYGYDWPTAGPGMGDPATGPATPMSYAAIMGMGAHVYWDPETETPWTSYQVGNQWHQTWFDDPTSLTLKARLANTYHIGGLGIWALGMEGQAPAMLAALLGDAPVVKDALPGPPATVPAGTPKTPSSPGAPSTPNTPGTPSPPNTPNASNTPGAPGAPSAPTTTATPTYHYTAIWSGIHVTLTPIAPTSVLQAGTLQPAGQLTNFTTDDPGRECLASGLPLNVEGVVSTQGVYIVSAVTPTDCTQGSWEFSVAPGTPTPTTTTTQPPTTSTTSAASAAARPSAAPSAANTG